MSAEAPTFDSFRSLRRVPVVLAGREFQASLLPAAVTDAIAAALPAPRPPLAKDPNAGSLAPKIADRDDPVYRAKTIAHACRLDAAELAWAVGYRTENGLTPPRVEDLLAEPADPGAVCRDYCTAAASELRSVLSQAEIRAALEAVASLASPDRLRSVAEGNSERAPATGP